MVCVGVRPRVRPALPCCPCCPCPARRDAVRAVRATRIAVPSASHCAVRARVRAPADGEKQNGPTNASGGCTRSSSFSKVPRPCYPNTASSITTSPSSCEATCVRWHVLRHTINNTTPSMTPRLSFLSYPSLVMSACAWRAVACACVRAVACACVRAVACAAVRSASPSMTPRLFCQLPVFGTDARVTGCAR